MVDQPDSPSIPTENLEGLEDLEHPDLRGLPDISQPKPPEEEEEEPDQSDLEAAFKLHDQICSKVEEAATLLHDVFPLIEKFSQKISEGDNQEYRLDRRLRVPSLVQTIVAAHSHLGRAARSARAVSAIQKDSLAEDSRPVFE